MNKDILNDIINKLDIGLFFEVSQISKYMYVKIRNTNKFRIIQTNTGIYDKMKNAIKNHYIDMIEYMIYKDGYHDKFGRHRKYSHHDRDCFIGYSAYYGFFDLVKYFIKSNVEEFDLPIPPNVGSFNIGMANAAEGGHICLVEYFVKAGACNWNICMRYAAKGSHINLVEYMIQKGAYDWNDGLCGAAEGGHMKLIKYFIEKGANNSISWHNGLQSAIEGEHIQLIKFFIDKGASNYDMYSPAFHNNKNVIDIIVENGANDWNAGLEGAIGGDHNDLIKFFVEKGANNFERCLYYSIYFCKKDLIYYFMKKLIIKRSIYIIGCISILYTIKKIFY